MKKIVISFLLLFSVGFLTGCNKEEKERIEMNVRDYKPVKKYSEGRAEEYVVEAKTPEEIASEVFREQLGVINNRETSFEIAGILDENIFVKSAVLDGGNIPTVSGLSEEDINAINANGGVDVWEDDNLSDFDALINNRNLVVGEMSETSEKRLAESIQNAMAYQERLAEESGATNVPEEE